MAAGNTASAAVTTTDRVLIERDTDKAKPTELGEDIDGALTGTPDLYRSGTYRFDNLETAGLRNVNGADTWVVYGYKVRVSDPRVAENELFRAKYHLTGAGYRENSDLTGDNKLVEPTSSSSFWRRWPTTAPRPTAWRPTTPTSFTRRHRTTTTRRRIWCWTRTATGSLTLTARCR